MRKIRSAPDKIGREVGPTSPGLAHSPGGAPSSAAVDLAGLDVTIGFMLRLAQVAVFNDLIATLKPYGLRPTDLSVLLVVQANPGLKQQEIGSALRIQRPNLVSIIDDLEARRLVKREQVPTDRRSYALHLTPDGEALMSQAAEAHRQHVARVDAAVGPARASELLDALGRIAVIAAD